MSRTWRLALAIILGTAGSAASAGWGAESEPRVVSSSTAEAEHDAFITQAMEAGGIPGLQTVVVKRGRVVWSRSYGHAVLAQPGPLTGMKNDSILWIASTSKMLVAIAVMQQVEKGRLALDDDINRYVPFTVRNPRWPEVAITWRMLLTHTSSMVGDDEWSNSFCTYGGDSLLSLGDSVKRTFSAEGPYQKGTGYSAGKPGTERIYSNDAVDLVGFALEGLVHEPFDDYVAREIVRPLRMSDSGYFPRKLPASRLTVGYGSARGTDGRFTYTPSRASWAHGPVGGSVLEHQFSCANYPSGMLHTSAEQYARLLMMVMNGGTLDGAQILKPASVDLMLTPSGFSSPWGYRQGLVFQSAPDLDGHPVWGHDGQDRGAASAAFFNRETGVGALAFANANWADYQLSMRLVDLDLHMMSWFQ